MINMNTMPEDVRKKLIKSHQKEVICEPYLKELFRKVPGFEEGEITILQIEDKDNEVCKHLDMVCGRDYQVTCGNHSVGLAWRAEACRKSKYPDGGCYNAFSCREKGAKPGSENYSEIKKRTEAIKYDLDYPKYTAQVFYDITDNERIISLALAKTKDIYEAHEKGYWRLTNCVNSEKQVWMHHVSWALMKKAGYTVYDWYADDSCRPTCFLDFPPVEYKRVI